MKLKCDLCSKSTKDVRSRVGYIFKDKNNVERNSILCDNCRDNFNSIWCTSMDERLYLNPQNNISLDKSSIT